MDGVDILQSSTSLLVFAEHMHERPENGGILSSCSHAICEPVHSGCCPRVRVKFCGCGTVVPRYEVVRGSCCELGFCDICAGALLGTVAGSSPVYLSPHVGSDCLIDLVVDGGLSTIVDTIVAPESDPLQLKRGHVAAVSRQARRQTRRRADRQARRKARRDAMRRSEKRRKEAGKRHARACREVNMREQISLCLSYFCALFGFPQPGRSLAKRLTKKVRQSLCLDARLPHVVSGVADVKKSQDYVVRESSLRNFTANRHTGWVGRRWLGVVGGCRWIAGSRWVGCRRYACARCSPGCGVNRRRRFVHSQIRSSASEFSSMSQHSRVGRTRERDAISRFAGALRSGDVWPECCGSRLGIWRRKCLQRVIHCCKGRMQVDAERWFRRRCQNNAGSGCGHSQAEARNFSEVLSFLRSQKCYVRVLASATRQRFSLGDACGGWQLGDSGGRCVGGVVWFVAEQHAMMLRGAWEGLGEVETEKAPPWLLSVVGAPKGRKSRKKHRSRRS
jgi:hypothetical protein